MVKQAKTAILCLSHFEGGMELDAIKQTKLFKKNGIDTILICRKSTFLEEKAQLEGLEPNSIAFKSKLSYALIKGLRNIIKEHNITTIIFFGASEIKSIYFAVKGIDCKVIVRHGTTKSSSKKDFIHKIFYSCVSKHVAISEHLRKNVLDIIPCNKEQVLTIYNTVGSASPVETRPKEMSFLHVGRVERGKGVYDAIEALSIANIPNSLKKITFVGRASEQDKSKLVDIAKKNHISVSFSGFVSNTEDYYSKNKFLLFPSYGEGLPNVILESLKYGLTCITYNNTVFPEFKSIGFANFYIADNMNTYDLAKKIESAINEDQDNEINPHTTLFKAQFNEETFISRWKNIIK
ncbi:glycosyltransferase [Vibrio sp. 404]|uniref:Glycosyltransferase n=1 Tax=Vibrio marinisediminis TaxID=2758441 RepID=A0A7W2FRC9_9VIBR|nr:glycosyltransferase [Vibrio marinisediminis]MBA5762815.1 glycosyltransferase [Vibrio marinisediminis]